MLAQFVAAPGRQRFRLSSSIPSRAAPDLPCEVLVLWTVRDRLAQSIHQHANKSLNRSFRGRGACCFEGVEAQTCQFFAGYIRSDTANLRRLRQQAAQDPDELLLWVGHVFVLMNECCEFSAVLVPLERDERVGVEHRFEPTPRFTRLISQLREMLEVLGDVPLVPCDQDWFNAREVFVKGGSADARLFSDL
jgi:hypothetical protein